MAFDPGLSDQLNSSRSRYEDAIVQRKKENARKGKSKKFLAEADHQELHDWLMGTGEFADVYEGEDYERRFVSANPLTNGMFAGDFGTFLLTLRDNLWDWGSLTPKQAGVVRNALVRARERSVKREEFKAEAAAKDAKSVFIGDIKERRMFDLHVRHVLSFEGEWGLTFINLCNDTDGNVVVCKGTKRMPKGENITVKATVKAHEERDGVKQTLINRPVWTDPVND